MQKTGKKRDTIDKFYTNPIIVNKYVKIFKDYINHDDTIIEPSAGSGSWMLPLQEYNLIAFDIQPEGSNIQQKDFLEVDLSSFQSNLHFIGNPPFGRQSSLAKKFIKHICSCDRTQTVAFILPKSFKKMSCRKVFPRTFHLEFQEDIQKDGFLLNNKPYDVPCIFQIWVRKDYKRYIAPVLTPEGYIFVKKDETPDYSLRRVGVYAGKIDRETVNNSFQSHYFIKLDKDYVNFVEKYDEYIKWGHNNTVGPRSISKQEFIREINKLICLLSTS